MVTGLGRQAIPLLIGALLCVSCTAQRGTHEAAAPAALEATDGSALPLAGLPPLPLLDLPEPRRTSLTQEIVLNGTDAWQFDDDVQGFGTSLIFEASNDPVWATFKFGGLMQTDEPQVLSLSLENNPDLLPADVYVGVSDYARKRWHWYNANSPAAQFAISLSADNAVCSPAGNLYVCVLALGEPLQLHDLTLSFDYFARPPVDLRAGQGTSRSAIELTWTDPDITYPGGQDFEYDSIVVERATGQVGPWAEIDRVAQGITEYADLNAPSLGPVKLHYRLRVARGQYTTAPCVPDIGYVDFAPQIPEVTGLPKKDGPFDIVAPAPAYGQLSALGAFDPDGGAVTFEWQFDGGSWESTGLQPVIFHTFNAYTQVTVRVTDDEGTSITRDFNQPVLGFAKKLATRGPGGNLLAFSEGMVDPSGNVILTLPQGTGFCKLDQDLNPLWVRAWDVWQLKAGDCAADGSILAHTSNIVARFSADGDLAWAKQVDKSGFSLHHVKASTDGRSWVVGRQYYFPPNNSIYSVVLALLESDGQLVFCKEFIEGAESQSWHPYSCAVNSQGEIVMALSHPGVADEDPEPLLVKVNQAGEIVWQKALSDNSEFGLIQGARITYGDAATPYIITTGGGFGETYLFAVSELGDLQWDRSVDYPSGFDAPLVSFSDGEIFLDFTGSFGRFNNSQLEVWTRESRREKLLAVYNGHPIIASESKSTDNWKQGFYGSDQADLTLSDSSYNSSELSLNWIDIQLEEVTPPVLEVPTEDMTLINFEFGGTPLS